MNALKSERFWLVGGALAAVVLAAVAWFGAISPELSNASSLDSQTADAQTQNLTLQAKIRKLQRDNADMTELTQTLQQARTALPFDTGVADYTHRLNDYAAQYHVTVAAVNASAPVSATAKPGQPAAPVAGATAGKLFALPLTVIIKGNTVNDLLYLKALQADPRAGLVSSIQVAGEAAKAGTVTQLTIQLQVFVAPQTPDVMAALEKQLATTSN
jgi:hypothetical protein